MPDEGAIGDTLKTEQGAEGDDRRESHDEEEDESVKPEKHALANGEADTGHRTEKGDPDPARKRKHHHAPVRIA